MIFAALFVRVTQADVFNMPLGQKSLQFATVSDLGNAVDTTGYGSVSYLYNIGKYDATTAQYASFLNAVAKADPYALYDVGMTGQGAACGITQNGSSGSYSYTLTSGCENRPVTCVSWGDAARFCNWLQNGQPTGVLVGNPSQDA
jgi:formylglycine-generating enzyme